MESVLKCFQGAGEIDKFIPFMHASIETMLSLMPASHTLLLSYARALFSMVNEENEALKEAVFSELHEILLLSLQYHFVPVVRFLLNSYASLPSPTAFLTAASLVSSVVASCQTLGKVHAEIMTSVTDWVVEKAIEWRKQPSMHDIVSIFGLRGDSLPYLQYLFLSFVHILSTQLMSRSANTQFVFALCYSLLLFALIQMSLKRSGAVVGEKTIASGNDTPQSTETSNRAPGPNETSNRAPGPNETSNCTPGPNETSNRTPGPNETNNHTPQSNETRMSPPASEKILISSSKVKVIASALSAKGATPETNVLSSEGPNTRILMDLRLLFVASEIHSLLARYDCNGCVCNHGCLPFLNLFIVSLCFNAKDYLVYKEMAQCFQCGLSIYAKGRNMLTHSARQQCTLADMLPLDARVLFNMRCLIDHDPMTNEYVRQLNQTLIEWSDIACRKMGRGPVTREAIILGIYSAETTQIVDRLLAFRTTPITKRDVDELVKELKPKRFDVMSRIFLMKIQDQINWTKRDGWDHSSSLA